MNEIEKELELNNIINFKGFITKNKKKVPIKINIDVLLEHPGLYRKLVALIWTKIKNINFNKLIVIDNDSLIIAMGLFNDYNVKIEKAPLSHYKNYNDCILLVSTVISNTLFTKRVTQLDVKYTIILFDLTEQIECVKHKLEILFCPKKKKKKTCLVLNWKKFNDIVKVIHYYGNKLEIVKIYVNGIDNFDKVHFCKLSHTYQFLIWEGTLFSSNVNIFFHQITGSLAFHKWVHMIDIEPNLQSTLHLKKIISALDSNMLLNVSNELDITYFYKHDYYNKKCLDIFNET